ncbi:phosphatase PAP2 family protein [Candidatus Marsarchaeota archaeon]|nr:phosphatase PAP2 family protein [Candidatus Marsarchaeota archaeon]MCL5404900.1 phosphatase PAP2 family protein [Candidatus Marsarchaeota archaeon]
MVLLIEAYKIGINIWAFEAAKLFVSPYMNFVMYWLAKSFLVVIPVLVIYMFLKKDMNVYSLVVLGILLYVISDTIKILTKEPRPCNIPYLDDVIKINYISCESTFSFPSNHASVLTGLAIFLKDYKYLRVAYIAWLLLILFGRVYLGLHYFTDILAGVGLSLLVAYIIYRGKGYINGLLNNIAKKIFPILAIKK